MSKGTVRKKIFAKGSRASGGGDPTIPGRVTNLENNVYKIAYFTEINSQSGTISIPTGATILLNQLPAGADALVATKDATSGIPTGENPVTAGNVEVDVASFDALGNYSLTGNCSSYPVCLIYWLSIKAIDFSNLTTANILEETVIQQADWAETDTHLASYIRNKPGIVLPYIDISWTSVYSATMTGAGSLVEGQLYRVTGIPLFPSGTGIASGYFIAYRNPADSRVYLNAEGYARLIGTKYTVSAIIDWYIAPGPILGNPEFVGFAVPDLGQSYIRSTNDFPDNSQNALYSFGWGDENSAGAEFINAKLKDWDKGNVISYQTVVETTINGNSHTGCALKGGYLQCNTFHFKADNLSFGNIHIDAPQETLQIDQNYQFGHYITGLEGTIQRDVDFNIAYNTGTKELTLPINSEFVGIFYENDATNLSGITIDSIVGGYSKLSPFWIRRKDLKTGNTAYQPVGYGSEDATHNIWESSIVDPNFTYAGITINDRPEDGIMFRYISNPGGGNTNMVKIIKTELEI